jgi:electron transport complex protein RnfE
VWRENPLFVMLLGMCPTLAVTNSIRNALAMGLATLLVLVASGALVSATRRWVPNQVRLATYIVIIATFVTMVDYAIQAISLELYNALGAFIQLIVVNCIILGRAEGYASRHRVTQSIVDAFGVGTGFALGLLALGGVRELLGSGTLLGFSVFGPDFQPWVILILPPGGFFVLGGWMLLLNALKARQQRRLAGKEAADGA